MKSKTPQILVWLFMLATLSVTGQPYTLKVRIPDHLRQPVFLADVFGDKNKELDTAFTDETGLAVFDLGKGLQPGMYRLTVKPSGFADIIFCNENIEIQTVAKALMDSIQVLASEENQLYFSFLRAEQLFQRKLELLKSLVDNYPPDDPFFKDIKLKFRKLQEDREAFILQSVKKNPDKFVSRIIQRQLMPFLDPDKTAAQRLFDLKFGFFDRFPFDDTLLLRTDVYTSKAIGYLSLYSDRNFTQEQLEDNFIKAVDVVLAKARKNQRVYEFILNYFTKGFEKYGFEKVLLHMAEKYVNENKCDDGQSKTDLQRRMENYIKLAVGKTAPDFQVKTLNGQDFKPSDIKAEYTLLIFWSSTCPHCKELLPELKKFYEGQKDKRVEFVGISLDTDRAAWEKEVKAVGADWIQCSDLSGWGGLVPSRYNIYATPTMYLLDRNRVIVAKPITYNQFLEEFQRL